MREYFLRDLLERVKEGKIEIEKAIEEFKDFPFFDLANTKIDSIREIRRGVPEIIYGEGKRLEDLLQIVKALRKRKEDVLITRLEPKLAKKLREKLKEGEYNEIAKCFFIKDEEKILGKGLILVVSAGTSDLPVAEEAYVTSVFLGNRTEKLYDVGVAGIHRLTLHRELLKKARVIICVAGMEGALPSVIAGLVSAPVIAVPTSIGYGASFGGLSALLGMLNSCSTVAVFNIDNGFGAAYFATLINRL